MKLEGILPAVVTPLDADGNFAPAPYERLLERLFAAGSDGLYVAGQTGEGMLLPVGERKRLLEVSASLMPPGKLLIVHIGALRTQDAVELARHAAKTGVAAVSSLPPPGPWPFAEIKEYYRAVSAASDLPFFVYYFPEVSGAIRTMDEIEELLALPHVAGLKFTDYDLYRLSRLTRAGATVFNGRDEVLCAGLLMGAHGGIGTFYNLAPDLFVEIFRLSRANKWTEARAVQDRVNDLITLTVRYPMLAAVKQMLEWTGIAAGACVGPRRQRLTSEECDGLRADLAASPFPHLAP